MEDKMDDLTKLDLEVIAFGLANFFKDEPEKITYWLLAENPNFGGLSPAQLIVMRDDAGLKKVANFVVNARDGAFK